MKAPSLFQSDVSYFFPTHFKDNQDKLLYFNTTDTKFLSKIDSFSTEMSRRLHLGNGKYTERMVRWLH